jgi:hypothetical protein|tara:strand:+ start:201 stop:377 length:177 start_codon:yes stop_codon:yes gene_type:complete
MFWVLKAGALLGKQISNFRFPLVRNSICASFLMVWLLRARIGTKPFSISYQQSEMKNE